MSSRVRPLLSGRFGKEASSCPVCNETHLFHPRALAPGKNNDIVQTGLENLKSIQKELLDKKLSMHHSSGALCHGFRRTVAAT